MPSLVVQVPPPQGVVAGTTPLVVDLARPLALPARGIADSDRVAVVAVHPASSAARDFVSAAELLDAWLMPGGTVWQAELDDDDRKAPACVIFASSDDDVRELCRALRLSHAVDAWVARPSEIPRVLDVPRAPSVRETCRDMVRVENRSGPLFVESVALRVIPPDPKDLRHRLSTDDGRRTGPFLRRWDPRLDTLRPGTFEYARVIPRWQCFARVRFDVDDEGRRATVTWLSPGVDREISLEELLHEGLHDADVLKSETPMTYVAPPAPHATRLPLPYENLPVVEVAFTLGPGRDGGVEVPAGAARVALKLQRGTYHVNVEPGGRALRDVVAGALRQATR